MSFVDNTLATVAVGIAVAVHWKKIIYKNKLSNSY